MNRASGLKISISKDSLINISVALFVLLYFLPISILLPSYIRSFLQLLCIGMFLMYLFLSNCIYIFFYVVAAGVVLIYYFLSWSEMWDVASYMASALVSLMVMICSFLVIDGDVGISRWVLWLTMILAFVTAITTIIGLIQYPFAIRELGTKTVNIYLKTIYREKNIAGWELIFGIAFCQGSFTYLWKRDRKLFYLVVVIADEIAIILSQLGFAIIFSFMLISLVCILGKNRHYKRGLLLIILTFLLCLIQRKFLLGLLLKMADKTGLYFLKLRARNLYDLIVMRNFRGDTGARFGLYSKSIGSFIHYPFGLITAPSGPRTKYLGFHSELFDLTAALGVFGLGIIIWLWIYMACKIRRRFSNQEYIFAIIVFFVFIIFWFINPVIYAPHIWFGALLFPAMVLRMNERLVRRQVISGAS